MTDYRDFYRELRTDWLKLRGYLFDPNTSLPALPMVLDGVRRKLEAGERIGLIYIDPSSGGHLESTHGWQAYDQLVRGVAGALRESSLGRSGLGILALTGIRSDELVMFLALGASTGEPADGLEQLRAELLEEIRAGLETQPESALRPPIQSAAVVLETTPTVRIERSIYHALQRARARCRKESELRHSDRLSELDRILGERDLVVRYQPIVDLESGSVHGLEALSTPPSRAVFESPDMLFSFAEENDRILELDRLCRTEAMSRSSPLLGPVSLAPGSKLFLNCSAQVFHDETLLGDLLGGARASGLETDALVLEITERVAITEWQDFRRSLDSLREAGVQVAIDDMGSGYSSLQTVAEIEPDYLKFDLSLVSGIHESPIKREMLSTLVTLARNIGAKPVAEGIEKNIEFETIRGMGIDYGQGYFFGHPLAPLALGHGSIHFPE